VHWSLTGTLNLRWPEVLAAARLADELGFESFHTSDHLQAVAGFDPDLGALDAVALVVALAATTERIRLGCMVSPISTRHPVVLARTLQTADLVSGGRVEVGIGAGWHAAEHAAFGLPFASTAERLADLEAACATMTALWESTEAVELDGRFPLHGARFAPVPPQRRIPLLVAGASAGALRIAARWAQAWNGSGSPALLADRIAALRAAELEVGRPAGSVQVTAMLQVFVSEDAAEVAARRAALAAAADGPRRPSAQARATLPGEPPGAAGYIGPPEGLAEHLASYERAGVQRIVLSAPRPWDPGKLRLLASAAGVARTPGAERAPR
jgi:alkanesulfonate monooxygenase SsuD/methylene tetrahydromethanopterin reductase-like flavin-dependent oxidoreductase (luciferase family)